MNEEQEKQRQLSSIDMYINRVYKFVVLLLPIFCLCASVTITIVHYCGFYPNVNETALFLFCVMDLGFLAIGFYLNYTGFDENGIVKPERIKLAKIVMAVILVVQWNAISYIWPFNDFWPYCVLFVECELFFFDVKFTGCTTFLVVLSEIISWFVYPERLLPARDELFVMNMVCRMLGITLMLLSINITAYFGGKFLVEELEKYANYDTLTHLLNRKNMDNYLKSAYISAKDHNAPFCLLMLDIDDFKKVNDTYGHDCGDAVLKHVAQFVSFAVRKEDNVFRWGGEEILILLKNNECQAYSVAERIRYGIENSSINYRNEFIVKITVTIGVCAYKTGMTIQKMMDVADSRLYYGKQNGKNQVVLQTSIVKRYA